MSVPDFEAICYVTSVLRPHNLPESLAWKVVLFKNDLKMAKIFHMVIS